MQLRQLYNLLNLAFSRNMAEGEGFEPPEPCGSTVFKTAAIGHSATLPNLVGPIQMFFYTVVNRTNTFVFMMGAIKSAG